MMMLKAFLFAIIAVNMGCGAPASPLPDADPTLSVAVEIVKPKNEPACSLAHPFAEVGYYVGLDFDIYWFLGDGTPGWKGWGTPDCSGRGVASDGYGRPCVQFYGIWPLAGSPPLDPERKEGAVYCIDYDAPVSDYYRRDEHGACVKYQGPTGGQLYEWAYCGTLPLPRD
jgi:hypothetical protein